MLKWRNESARVINNLMKRKEYFVPTIRKDYKKSRTTNWGKFSKHKKLKIDSIKYKIGSRQLINAEITLETLNIKIKDLKLNK